MSNYAALIAPLSICGSLKTDGTPNVNGLVYFYSPGTTTPVTVYADAAATIAVTAPVTLDAGGRFPYATYPNGIYTTQPIRLLVQDSTGLVMSDTTFQVGAGSSGLSNAGFPNETTVDQAFTALYASLGGIDGQFSPFVGATPLPVYKVLSGIQLTPQMFGAKGDGLNDDTNAIQAAINKAAANSGGIVYLSPGTYKISSAITYPANTVSVSLVGAGAGATVLSQSGTADVITVPSGSDLVFGGLSVSGNMGLTNTTRMTMRNVIQSHGNSTSAYGISLSACSIVSVVDSIFGCATGQSAVAISGASGSIYLDRARMGGAGTFNCIDIAGSASSIFVDGCLFNGSGGVTGIKFESGYTGTGIYVTNCPTLGGNATPIDTSAISNDPGIYQRNCGMDYILTDNITATGQTLNPNPLYGTAAFRFTGGGGSTAVVGTPSPNPTAALKGKRFSTYFVNATGGTLGVTYAAGAGQFITAVSVPTANGTRMHHNWEWDGSNWILLSSGQAA